MKRLELIVVSGLLFAGLASMRVLSQETIKGMEAAKPAGTDAYANEPFVVERIQTTARFEVDRKSQRELTTKVRVQSEADRKAIRAACLSIHGNSRNWKSCT